MIEDKKLKKLILFSSILLFVFSLTQKCYCTTTTCGDSIMAFLLGWAAIFSGAAGFAWLANPILLIAWFTLKKKLKTSMFLSIFSTLISLSFLLAGSIVDNEGGGSHQIRSYELGYWAWVTSNIVMLIGTFILMLRHNTRNAVQPGITS